MSASGLCPEPADDAQATCYSGGEGTVDNIASADRGENSFMSNQEPPMPKSGLLAPPVEEANSTHQKDLKGLEARIDYLEQHLKIVRGDVTKSAYQDANGGESDESDDSEDSDERVQMVENKMKALSKPENKSKDELKPPIYELKCGDYAFFERPTKGNITAYHNRNAPYAPKFQHVVDDREWLIEVLTGKKIAGLSNFESQRVALDGENAQTPFPERIRVRSKQLLECLGQLANSNDGGFGSEALVFMTPFKCFVRDEKKIRARLQDLEEAQVKTLEVIDQESGRNGRRKGIADKQNKDMGPKDLVIGLKLFVDEVLDGVLARTLHVYKSLKNKTATHISFEHLYYLFEHNQVIVHAGDYRLYRVYGFSGGRDIMAPNENDKDRQPGFTIDCYHIESNGRSYGPIASTFSIGRFYGEKEITMLNVFPLEFHPCANDIRQQAAERSSRYIELSTQDEVIHREYCGLSLDDPPDDIESRIIVDHVMAARYNQHYSFNFGVRNMTQFNDRELIGRCLCMPGCDVGLPNTYHQDLEDDKQATLNYFADHKHFLQPSDDIKLPLEEDVILLPDYVYGFVLKSRTWAKLKLDTIKIIVYTSSFDKLVLPAGHAKAIKALVRNHSRESRNHPDRKHVEIAMDLVRGKGKGLIILLHGEPGVGKTSTAECIADDTNRPLFPLTCGDIGSQAEKVEANLGKVFQLAHKWGCVVLLDEADVFLQERARDDIERNAVVSVFLRTMEYYSGILFLTTNRVGTLDQAFRSRIHLSLFYPSLSRKATMKIWRMHIKTAKDLFSQSDREIIIGSEEENDILDFANDHFERLEADDCSTWNGRQIKNAFQTAIALAVMDAGDTEGTPRLQGKYFETIANSSKEFDDYFERTQGISILRYAKHEKLRDDSYRLAIEREKDYAKGSTAKQRNSRKKKKAKAKKTAAASDSESEVNSDGETDERS